MKDQGFDRAIARADREERQRRAHARYLLGLTEEERRERAEKRSARWLAAQKAARKAERRKADRKAGGVTSPTPLTTSLGEAFAQAGLEGKLEPASHYMTADERREARRRDRELARADRPRVA